MLLIAAALAVWLRARRAETPGLPTISTGARALEAGRGQPEQPGTGAGGGSPEEITPPEKQELDRVLREHGGAQAR